MPKASTCWIRSKWSKSDLNGRSVEFDFSVGKNRWTKGSGTFRVKEREKGELAITIDVGGRPLCTEEGGVLYLTQSLADTIQRCPPTSSVNFLLCQGF